MSVAAIKSALSAQFASLATATTPLDPDPATNADLIYGRMATALYNAIQVGRTGGGFPAAGEIGETVISTFNTACAATTVTNVAAITLSPGDWDLSVIATAPASAAGYFVCGISPTSGTRGNSLIGEEAQAATTTLTGVTVVVPRYGANHSTSPNKVYYAVAQYQTGGNVFGLLSARRRS